MWHISVTSLILSDHSLTIVKDKRASLFFPSKEIRSITLTTKIIFLRLWTEDLNRLEHLMVMLFSGSLMFDSKATKAEHLVVLRRKLRPYSQILD